MEAQDPLSELADIHLPGAISLWPPAFGWWILAAALLLAILYCIRLFVIRHIRLKKLAYATSALEEAYQRFSEQVLFDKGKNQAGLNFLNETNSILKRVALLIAPSNVQVANLSGKAWLEFLDEGINSIEFSSGAGKALGDAIYRRQFDGDGDAIYRLAQQWIIKCYKEASVGAQKHQDNANSAGMAA